MILPHHAGHPNRRTKSHSELLDGYELTGLRMKSDNAPATFKSVKGPRHAK